MDQLIMDIQADLWPFVLNCSLVCIALSFAAGVTALVMSSPAPRWRDPHAADCGIRTRGICDCEESASFARTLGEARKDEDIEVAMDWIRKQIAAAKRERDREWLARSVLWAQWGHG